MIDGARPRRARQAGRGFTLLEVLVALTVLAIALAAALQAAGRGAANLAYLRDRTFANWVAGDELTRRALLPEWPEPGLSRGIAVLADREWPWELEVGATGDESVRRLQVRVETEAGPLASLTGFVLRPLAVREGGAGDARAQGQTRTERRSEPDRKGGTGRKGGPGGSGR